VIGLRSITLWLLVFCSCHATKPLVNFSHLQHLYEERNINGQTLGIQWIYCEAPDFRLVGDEDEGYTCIDDVARALVVYCREAQQKPNEQLIHKIEMLSNFILHMQHQNGYFYNFMFKDGTINTSHQNSVAIASFWSWRAYWALTELMLVDDKRLYNKKLKCQAALEKIEQNITTLCEDKTGNHTYDGIVLPSCISQIGSDQMAEILKGLSNRYIYDPSDKLKNLILLYADQIILTQKGSVTQLPYYAFLSWQNYWHAWGNSQSYALLNAGTAVKDTLMIRAGLNEIDYFYPYLIYSSHLSGFKLISNINAYDVIESQQFSQIAYGISPMIMACTEAYHITKNKKYEDMSFVLASWYFGNNIANATIYDIKSGRAYDGINGKDQVNKNAGAESTIESLLAMQSIQRLSLNSVPYKNFVKKYIDKKK
jgi:hypothetical protein